MIEEITLVPIDQIRILNPRLRDKRKFAAIVQSIKNQGLKKPIKISSRKVKDGEEPGYDLICGQGRIEAFQVLGHKEIPAVIVEISKEDRLLMSLVENMARKPPLTVALIEEIDRLMASGYNIADVSRKLDLANPLVGGLVALSASGEERLLDEAVRGRIPISVAMEIARTENADAQRELLKAYESGQLNCMSIRVVKRLMDQRQHLGKHRQRKLGLRKSQTTADGMVNAYRKQSQKQKLMIKKARVCESRLMFAVTAFKQLLRDENFINLLRGEGVSTMPKILSDHMKTTLKEAA